MRAGMAVVLLPLLLGLAWGGLGPTRAAAQEGTEGAAFLSAFRDAWVTGAVERVLPLFAPEAVVILTREDPESPEEYRGDTTPAPLRAGVAALLRSGAQLDLAGAQTGAKGAMVDGVPTTSVRWTYQHPGAGLPVPPEIGTDELVLRGGRILTYTRTPEGANQRARARALDRHIASLAAQLARATVPAAATPDPPAARPQERRTPAVAPWLAALGAALGGVGLLALLPRPREAP